MSESLYLSLVEIDWVLIELWKGEGIDDGQ